MMYYYMIYILLMLTIFTISILFDLNLLITDDLNFTLFAKLSMLGFLIFIWLDVIETFEFYDKIIAFFRKFYKTKKCHKKIKQ